MGDSVVELIEQNQNRKFCSAFGVPQSSGKTTPKINESFKVGSSGGVIGGE